MRHRTLPRIFTDFQLNHTDYTEDRTELKKPVKGLPGEIVELIVDWAREFQRAEIKMYYYSRFMKSYAASLVRSSSRLRLYTRELKSLSMKHRTLGSPPTLLRFIRDAKRCKRDYDYEQLSGIFF